MCVFSQQNTTVERNNGKSFEKSYQKIILGCKILDGHFNQLTVFTITEVLNCVKNYDLLNFHEFHEDPYLSHLQRQLVSLLTQVTVMPRSVPHLLALKYSHSSVLMILYVTKKRSHLHLVICFGAL